MHLGEIFDESGDLKNSPKSGVDLFAGLLAISGFYVDHFWPNLLSLLLQRKKRLNNVDSPDFDLAAYVRLTYSTIVLFFSYLESSAQSTRQLLRVAEKRGLLQKLSGKQKSLLNKDPKFVRFEELMKIQFSILPMSVGVSVDYGTIKQTTLKSVFALRKVRDRIVHPLKISDTVGVDIDDLEGYDINRSIIDYSQHVVSQLTKCGRKLAPSGKRDTFDRSDHIRRYGSLPTDGLE